MLLIDAANVVGSRPNGWCRDRAKATIHFVEEVRTVAARLPGPVVIVLEGAARRGVPEGAHDDVVLIHAPGQGDDTLVALALAATEAVVLVSADRAPGGIVVAVPAQMSSAQAGCSIASGPDTAPARPVRSRPAPASRDRSVRID